MSERVVKLTVTAQVNSYLAGMDLVARKTREGRTEAEQLTAKLEAQRKAIQFTGAAMVAGGGLIAAGLALAIKKAAEFDEAMSHVQAATHESAENMAKLRDAAIDAGARTVFSAKEAANAIEELAKAGISTADILAGGLDGALDLAAAGGLGVADAAGIAATALTQFKLKGDQASHVADLLAAGAGKAMGDVSDMSQALNQGGLVANQFGLSIEETTGTLAAFASNGLLGSDAGTSFKTMLQRLVPQSKQAQQTMDALGLSAFDSSGKFIGMAAYAGKLRSALGDMDDEQRNATLSVLFGSDAVRAASVIYDQGAEGIQGWIDKVNDQGYAAETAALRLDNLKGDIEQLGGAFDSLLISVGESGQGPLRAIVQSLTDLINVFNDMPEGGKTAVFWASAVTSAILLTGGTALLVVPKIAAYKAAIADLGTNAQRAGRLLGALGKGAGITAAIAAAITVASNALIAYAREIRGTDAAVNKATTTNESFVSSLKGLNTGLDSSQRVVKALNALSTGRVIGAIGVDVLALRDGLTELDKGLTEIPLENATDRFQAWTKELGLSRQQIITLLGEMPEFKKAIEEQLKSSGQAASKQDVLNFAMGKGKTTTVAASSAFQEQADRVNGVRDALRDLTDQINAENDAQLKAITAKSQFAEGLAQLKGQVKQYGDSLDMSERKGLANAAALGGLATDAQAAAQAQYELDQKTMGASEAAQKYAENLAVQRKKLEDAAVAAGFSRDEVKKLLDTVFRLPDTKTVKILADTSLATDAIAALKDRYNNTSITLKTKLKLGAKDSELAGLIGIGVPSRASGGILPGAPSSTDNMLAAVASGEFIVRASQVAIPENRRALEYMNAGGRMRPPGYAGGGFVQPTYASSRPGTTVTVAAPSLDGLGITGRLEIGGDGLARIIDGRIVAADTRNGRSVNRGRR